MKNSRGMLVCFLSRTGLVLVLLLQLQPTASAQQPADAAATRETKNLYASLFRIQKTGVLFGHQDALAYGVGWKGLSDESDVQRVTGEHPGLFGWDIAGIEQGKTANIDGVPFSAMREHILRSFENGAAITISWHADNPLTAGNAWDTTHGSLASVLPGGTKHALYKIWLDRAAQFIGSLKTRNGTAVPVLFRPFHELTGNWFWWCRNNAKPDEFIALWRFTVSYLRDVKKIHQLLYVYNTADYSSEAAFLEYYPGDEWVDVLSFDRYQYAGNGQREQFISIVSRQLDIQHKLAVERKKPAAIAETGFEGIPDPLWWTQTLYPLLKRVPMAYVLLWRNHGYMPSTGTMHHYVPFPGHSSAKDFFRLYQLPDLIFERKVSSLQLYR
jgi:hypothetical protein